jgi:hypothetical protein
MQVNIASAADITGDVDGSLSNEKAFGKVQTFVFYRISSHSVLVYPAGGTSQTARLTFGHDRKQIRHFVNVRLSKHRPRMTALGAAKVFFQEGRKEPENLLTE